MVTVTGLPAPRRRRAAAAAAEGAAGTGDPGVLQRSRVGEFRADALEVAGHRMALRAGGARSSVSPTFASPTSTFSSIPVGLRPGGLPWPLIVA